MLDAGHRCIAPDHAGFGRSDKPTDLGWYSYDRHSELFAALLEQLDLRDATVVVHDWGGPIGLRAAVEQPDRIARMVVMDTGLFTGEQPMSDAWKTFRDFVERTEDLPISMLVKGACARGMDDEVAAAYEAPVPEPGVEGRRAGLPADAADLARDAGRRRRQAGARGAARRRAAEAPPVGRLRSDHPVQGRRAVRGRDQRRRRRRRSTNASHFLQEDAGEEIGAPDRRVAGGAAMTGPLYRLGGFCARHALVVFAIWILIAIADLARRDQATGSQTSDDTTIPGSDSTRATDLLERRSCPRRPTARSRS